MKDADALRTELMAKVDQASSLDDLEQIRVLALGKKGQITELMKHLGTMDADARKEAGQALGELLDQHRAYLRAMARRRIDGKVAVRVNAFDLIRRAIRAGVRAPLTLARWRGIRTLPLGWPRDCAVFVNFNRVNDLTTVRSHLGDRWDIQEA